MSKWHKGPPPSVGWWPVVVVGCSPVPAEDFDARHLGWWDGTWWSTFALPSCSASEAASYARMRGANGPEDIEWADRPASWPKRSRT